MLRPGVTLHVYGTLTAQVPEEQKIPEGSVGVLDDGDYRYLVFIEDARHRLDEAKIEVIYEATLPYDQWLDGDMTRPILIAGVLIVPPWCEPPKSEIPIIHLDPSLVFGTGAHPTTQRCLELIAALASRAEPPREVLDLGCGTGLLSFMALKKGASRAWACDTSRLAVEVASRNALKNSISDRFDVLCKSAAEVVRPADLVLANLPPAALGELIAHPMLRSASWIIASGMLASDLRRLIESLPSHVQVKSVHIDGCWHTALLEGQRRS